MFINYTLQTHAVACIFQSINGLFHIAAKAWIRLTHTDTIK